MLTAPISVQEFEVPTKEKDESPEAAARRLAVLEKCRRRTALEVAATQPRRRVTTVRPEKNPYQELFDSRRNNLVEFPARDHDYIKGALQQLRTTAYARRKSVTERLDRNVVLTFYSADGSRQEPFFLPKGTEVRTDNVDAKPVFVVTVPERLRLTLTMSKAHIPEVTIVRRVIQRSEERSGFKVLALGRKSFGSID